MRRWSAAGNRFAFATAWSSVLEAMVKLLTRRGGGCERPKADVAVLLAALATRGSRSEFVDRQGRERPARTGNSSDSVTVHSIAARRNALLFRMARTFARHC